MQTELEEAERAASKRQRTDKAREERERAQENERIKEEGRKLREERIEQQRKRDGVEEAIPKVASEDEDEVPPLGMISCNLSNHSELLNLS